MNSFNCFSLSPIELAHPGIAVATIRAGGIGVLDREFCSDRNIDWAIRSLNRLLDLVNPQDAVGLRLQGQQIASSQTLLSRLCGRPHWLILCGWNPQTLQEDIASLPTSQYRRILLEVTDIEQALAITNQSLAIDGLIAKGHESSGWVGEDSAFLLTQKLVERQSLPVYVQGGIGIHTVAACRAAGATGVVLDDQLWLMPESPLPEEWQRHLSKLNGQEAIVIGERLSGSCRVLSRPGFRVIPTLQKLAEQLEIQNDPSALLNWQQQAQPLLGWGAPGTLAWPMGQAVGLAAHFRDRHKTTGRFIQALLKASREHIETAQTLQPLQPTHP
jgi:NAD(P)H-dependent flavin oxidoreductase YrpB (nitropropane dioxygenase family)